MSITVVTGDMATTTTAALATTWPTAAADPADCAVDVPVVIELDPTGGSLGAWVGCTATPSLSTLVAAVRHSQPTWATISAHRQRHADRIDLIPAPIRSLEARRAVDECVSTVLPGIAAAPADVIVDTGRFDATHPSAALAWADCVVLVHRQDGRSPGAAGARIERLIEHVDALASAPRLVLAVIGERPFPLAEIADFVADRCQVVFESFALADDPLGAAVLAGRSGVSERRTRKLPLIRTASALSAALAVTSGLDEQRELDESATATTAATTAGAATGTAAA